VGAFISPQVNTPSKLLGKKLTKHNPKRKLNRKSGFIRKLINKAPDVVFAEPGSSAIRLIPLWNKDGTARSLFL
jgi:hypothetical protein